MTSSLTKQEFEVLAREVYGDSLMLPAGLVALESPSGRPKLMDLTELYEKHGSAGAAVLRPILEGYKDIYSKGLLTQHFQGPPKFLPIVRRLQVQTCPSDERHWQANPARHQAYHGQQHAAWLAYCTRVCNWCETKSTPIVRVELVERTLTQT